MSSHTASASAEPMPYRTFLLRRLHSLTGVIPLGVFLLFHFFENASVRNGPEAFNEAVVKISSMPYLYALEIGGLLLPLVFHGVYGLFITGTSRPNVVRYGFQRNWAYFFQRLSGFLAFVFITFHVATTRVWALYQKGDHITFSDMHRSLSSDPVFALYLLGIVAVTYHLANGLWSFSITWGLVVSHAAQRRLAVAVMALFVVLALVGVDIAWTFRFEQGLIRSLGIPL